MLPEAALTHFHHLLDARLASAAQALDSEFQSFNREETGGRGKGYVARLASVYARQLQPVAVGISESLREVHARFDIGLSDEVQREILRLAEESFQSWTRGMEGAFARHLGRFGMPVAPLDWGLSLAASGAGLQNSLHRYFWDLKNPPPMKHEATSTTVININSPVNVVQTGAGAVASVYAVWSPTDVAAAVQALTQLLEEMKAEACIPAALLVELENDVNNIAQEVQESAPSGARVTRWLGGIGASIQTIASLQPAWQMVQTAMKALGL